MKAEGGAARDGEAEEVVEVAEGVEEGVEAGAEEEEEGWMALSRTGVGGGAVTFTTVFPSFI